MGAPLEEARAGDAEDPLRKCRDRFVLPPGVLHLDGNSPGPLPAAAQAPLAGPTEAAGRA